MIRTAFAAAAAMAVTSLSPAYAAEEASEPFTCIALESFKDAAADTQQVRINNFSVRETPAVASPGTMEIEITYAIANRMDRPINVSGDFLLLDHREKPLVAMNADPLLNTVQPGKTETGRGATFVGEGALMKAKQICLRIFTTWRK
jgi:hypothetical protein